jgi:hypothetical protein
LQDRISALLRWHRAGRNTRATVEESDGMNDVVSDNRAAAHSRNLRSMRHLVRLQVCIGGLTRLNDLTESFSES